jgi:hypothetical protein
MKQDLKIPLGQASSRGLILLLPLFIIVAFLFKFSKYETT